MKIDRDLKTRLLAAITVGNLDFEKFPELVEACKEHSRTKPMTKDQARKIIQTLDYDLSKLTDEELITFHELHQKVTSNGDEKEQGQ
ncbi:hypothetical protein [Dysgonomonas mossii]|uniref:hypothetical protein n=1 Tax=Dysgonomonas mossii TaxID=163665 RepID=UPI003996939A